MACFHLDDHNASNASRTLRDDLSSRTVRDNLGLRAHFVQNVILPLQFILFTGYKIRAQEIFASPAPLKIIEEAPLKRVRSPMPVSVEVPQEVQSGFCLHDDGDQQPDKGNAPHTADKYMKQLQGCISKTLTSLPPAPSGSKGPVEIAILDTGADICESQRQSLYDGRLREIKTWLHSNKVDGEHLIDPQDGQRLGPPLDLNGHGTHGTSVLLNATEGTGIEIYVAQVFKGAQEKHVSGQAIGAAKRFVDDPTVTRIANSIKHAVDVWKFDIISMSFGYPEKCLKWERHWIMP
ncbi:hypothetical protein LTR95_003656 [Oleoguttula sp. CCFEE 5521]